MKNFDFIQKRVIFFIIAAVMIVASVLSMAIRGFNLDTDFVGGTALYYELGEDFNDSVTSAIKDIYDDKAGTAATVRTATDATTGNTQVVITSTELTTEQIADVKKAMAEKFENSEFTEQSSVGETVSRELKSSAVKAVIIAIILMLIYIWIRFDWRSGLSAIFCLAHDVIIMLGAYSLLQINMDSTVIAALLTILGYSINATIIVFDRVRENNKNNQKLAFAENANAGVRQTVTRSLNTTLTTLFTIGMIYILGVTSIRDFALPIIIGIVAGLYSSVCLATNFWTLLKGKKAFETPKRGK